MQIGNRCTICNDVVPTDEWIRCDTCDHHLHADCAEYVQAFECSECADEIAIGAQEF
jgi:hypothetical protein